MLTNTRFTRTTISLPEDILYELKKKALEDRKTITAIVTEGLTLYLKRSPVPTDGKESDNLISYFGSWGKGLSGKTTLKKLRSGAKEIQRDVSLKKSWKKY